jgi:hypothetical protein
MCAAPAFFRMKFLMRSHRGAHSINGHRIGKRKFVHPVISPRIHRSHPAQSDEVRASITSNPRDSVKRNTFVFLAHE